MFTGIIEEVGTVLHNHQQGQTLRLTVQAQTILTDIHLGDSISINGVCLTVVAFDRHSFSVDCVPETVRKTNLKHAKVGSSVNLERAMSAAGRFGGHLVSGHVDSIGKIISRVKDENAVVFQIEPQNSETLRYLLPTGSITVDGISLTVVEVSKSWFSIYIIPHTLAQTVLKTKHVGDEVNLECDIVGKYIERLLTFSNQDASPSHKAQITKQFLTDHGYV